MDGIDVELQRHCTDSCAGVGEARALSIYLLVFFGGMALGSAFWGTIAARIGIPMTLLFAAAALIAGLIAGYFFPLWMGEELNLDPSLHWADPMVVSEPHPEAGPVLVTVDYQIEPERAKEFVEAMQEMKELYVATVPRGGAYSMIRQSPAITLKLSLSNRGLNTCASTRV
jgi:hypothetical protein